MNRVAIPVLRVRWWLFVFLFLDLCGAQGVLIATPDTLLIWAGARARAEKTGETPPEVSATNQATSFAEGGQVADAHVQAGSAPGTVISAGHGQTDVLGYGPFYLLATGEGNSDSVAIPGNYAVYAETSGGGEFRISFPQSVATRFALQLDYEAQSSLDALFGESGNTFRLWMTYATESIYWSSITNGAQQFTLVGYIPAGETVDIHVIADASTKLNMASGECHASHRYTLNLHLNPLDILAVSDGVQLTWPVIAGYRLEGHAGPLGTGSWAPLDITPEIIAGFNVLHVPYDGEHVRFYRLNP